jgi:hypothetical protein
MRATFSLTLSGTPTETARAAEQLAEDLAAAGFFFDEDFTTIHSADWAVTGLELRSHGAVAAALDLLPTVGAHLIQTNPELA